jgi:endonuclease/exonuclease/phosphatase (EEP) superfamily protein YafD
VTGKHTRGGRVLPTTLTVISLAFVAVALIARRQPVSTIPRLILSVGSTFVPVAAVVGLVLAILSRRTLLAIFAVFLVTATVAIQVSWYYVAHPTDVGAHADIRVLSSNLRYGRADPTAFVGLAKASADVITVAELTPEAVTRFTEAGIEETFPYSVLIPGPGAGGIGLWSRYPLTPLSTPSHRGVSMPAARVQIPGIAYDPVLASAHIMSPVSDRVNTVEDWSNGMAGAKAQLANFAQAAGPGAVIVGGDYNSTPDMRQFRDLLTDGYRDAVGQTGSGFAPTYPSDTWFPPVITIDHVLTRNAEALSIKTIEMPGSDHRSLLVTVAVPLEPVATT